MDLDLISKEDLISMITISEAFEIIRKYFPDATDIGHSLDGRFDMNILVFRFKVIGKRGKIYQGFELNFLREGDLILIDSAILFSRLRSLQSHVEYLDDSDADGVMERV